MPNRESLRLAWKFFFGLAATLIFRRGRTRDPPLDPAASLFVSRLLTVFSSRHFVASIMGARKKEASRRERQGVASDGMANVKVKGENFYRYALRQTTCLDAVLMVNEAMPKSSRP